MNYATMVKRKQAGVCIECEGTPVVASSRCQVCAERFREYDRKRARERLQCTPRTLWSPEKQCFVLYDDREAYDQIRALVAQEIDAGAKGKDVCVKYKVSWMRLRKICVEHGVTFKRKPGDRDWTKTPERLALEAAVLADARAGMVLRDLGKKYPGRDVRGICRSSGVIPKYVEGWEPKPKKAAETEGVQA